MFGMQPGGSFVGYHIAMEVAGKDKYTRTPESSAKNIFMASSAAYGNPTERRIRKQKA